MPLPSSSKQQRKTSTAAESAESPLPMAAEGQLYWVKRPLSSLSTLPLSKTAKGDEDPPSLWWPSLLFNDYDEFQDFFPVEFDTKNNTEEKNNDAAETKGMILARIFQNMRLQRSIMVARLLGRSIKEYVEIVEEPDQEDSKSNEVEAHAATEFISFTRMPQEVHLPQMNPESWIVASSVESEGNLPTSIIDDDLYMSYMLALDLAATKRIGGPIAPKDTLGSDFRNIGREKLAKIPAEVKRLSGASSTALPNQEILKAQSPKGNEEKAGEDGHDGDSQDKVENKNQPEDAVEDEATEKQTDATKASEPQVEEASNESTSEEPATSKEVLMGEIAPDAEITDDEATEKQTDAAKVSEPSTGSNESVASESGSNKENLADETAPNKEITSPAASIDGDQPEAMETIDQGEGNAGQSLVASSAKDSPEASSERKGDEVESSTGTPTIAEVDSSKRSKRGRRPKTIHDLGYKGEDMATESSDPPFKEKKRPGRKPGPKPGRKPGPKPGPKKKAAAPAKNVRRGRSSKKVDSPETPGMTEEPEVVSPDTSLLSPPPRQNARTVTIEASPSSTGEASPGIVTDDSFANARKRSNAVTPISSTRSKRSRRSSSPTGDELDKSPSKEFNFKSNDEEEFYHFQPLMSKLKKIGWKYRPSKLRPWQYILPGHKSEVQRGKHLVDFFHEESEVILYCMNNNYYERREELGLL